jgi:hypothetical protein
MNTNEIDDKTLAIIGAVHLDSNADNHTALSRFKKPHHKERFDLEFGSGAADRVIAMLEAKK